MNVFKVGNDQWLSFQRVSVVDSNLFFKSSEGRKGFISLKSFGLPVGSKNGLKPD